MAYQQQYQPQYQQQSQPVVVMQQPVSQIAVVQPGRDWGSGVCGCFEDIGGCCYSMCCPCCFLAGLSTRMNENCMAICFAPVAMRTKLRLENGIRGGVCNDFCTMFWCGELVACQMDRELKKMGR